MKKYRVLLAYNAYKECEVEAEDEIGAIDEAEKRYLVEYCEEERCPDGDIVEEVQSESAAPKRKRYICKNCNSEFITKFTQTRCAFCMGQLEEKENKDERFVFYWTEDNDTGKGVKVYVNSEEEREKVLKHYFEASIGPLDGTAYNEEPIRYSGIIGSVPA